MAAEGPFASAHLLYTFSGALPSGEIWSVGLRTLAANTVPDQLQGFANAAMTAFKSYWNQTNGVGVFNPPTVTFTAVTVRQITLAGATAWQAVAPVTPATIGQGAGQNAPNQTALVVTTRTALSGRSGRGRFYLPLLTPILQTADGRLRQADCQALASGASALIGAIGAIVSNSGTAPAGPFRVGIQSRVAGRGANVVISTSVGNVADTQRRRRDKEIEVYSNSVVESA